MERTAVKLDWLTVVLFVIFVIFGWMNIYSASNRELDGSWFNLDYNYGKQLVWVLLAFGLGFVIMTLDIKFIDVLSYGVYGICILLVIGVTLFGREVNGARAWFEIGDFRLQPAEFAKIATAMALAKYISKHNFSVDNPRDKLAVLGIIGLPAVVIAIEDAGTALVFSAFIFMLFREGLSPIYLILGFLAIVITIVTLLMNNYVWLFLDANWILTIIIGVLVVLTYILIFKFKKSLEIILLHILVGGFFIGLVFSVDYVMDKVLLAHQQKRVRAVLGLDAENRLGKDWNVIQSKIAIGSGQLNGKGYLEGTQTKYDFVPQQDTDFIFCTIGEEWGWVGSSVLLILFLVFFAQLLFISENTKSRYGRVYGYSIASVFLFHIVINVGMTIGLAPVVGIPLPFFSYGGSSLVSFTVMLFILLNLYANRSNILMKHR